jgi:hypothetical protein
MRNLILVWSAALILGLALSVGSLGVQAAGTPGPAACKKGCADTEKQCRKNAEASCKEKGKARTQCFEPCNVAFEQCLDQCSQPRTDR